MRLQTNGTIESIRTTHQPNARIYVRCLPKHCLVFTSQLEKSIKTCRRCFRSSKFVSYSNSIVRSILVNTELAAAMTVSASLHGEFTDVCHLWFSTPRFAYKDCCYLNKKYCSRLTFFTVENVCRWCVDADAGRNKKFHWNSTPQFLATVNHHLIFLWFWFISGWRPGPHEFKEI